MKKLTEGNAKDRILEYSIENFGKSISVEKIKKVLFPENSIEELELLFERIDNTVDKVADVHISSFGKTIVATELTKVFIKQGGFTKIEKDNLDAANKKEKKEKIDFEKSQIELKLKKWQLKTFIPLFIIATIGFLFGVYNFINTLSVNKTEKKYEKRILSIEKELKELNTKIINQKRISHIKETDTLKIK